LIEEKSKREGQGGIHVIIIIITKRVIVLV